MYGHCPECRQELFLVASGKSSGEGRVLGCTHCSLLVLQTSVSLVSSRRGTGYVLRNISPTTLSIELKRDLTVREIKRFFDEYSIMSYTRVDAIGQDPHSPWYRYYITVPLGSLVDRLKLFLQDSRVEEVDYINWDRATSYNP